MTRVRPETAVELHAAIRAVAQHLPDPPPVHAKVARYAARHGVSHLTSNDQWEDALDFADRLEACDAEDLFGVPTDRSRDGFLRALSRCPPGRPLDAKALGRMLHRQPTAAGCRNACEWLLRAKDLDIDTPFIEQPNASRPATYALAEALAKQTEATGPAGLQRLSEWAEDYERPTHYAALYAFKYVGIRRPTWLTTESLKRHAYGDAYDSMVATQLLTYLAIQGHAIALDLKHCSFWSPTWDYNKIEIELLRGALRWRGLQRQGGEAFAAHLAHLEQRRVELQTRATSDEIKCILTNYWRLLKHLQSIDAALSNARQQRGIMDIVWLLMASPYWEVGERAAGIAGYWATLDPAIADRIMTWAQDERHAAVHRALALALRTHAQKSQNPDLLFKASASLSKSRDPHVRGFVAHAAASIFQDAPRQEWAAMLPQWQPILRAALHDDDIWAAQEIIELGRLFEVANVPWRSALRPESAPLLQTQGTQWLAEQWPDLLPPDPTRRSGLKVEWSDAGHIYVRASAGP